MAEMNTQKDEVARKAILQKAKAETNRRANIIQNIAWIEATVCFVWAVGLLIGIISPEPTMSRELADSIRTGNIVTLIAVAIGGFVAYNLTASWADHLREIASIRELLERIAENKQDEI